MQIGRKIIHLSSVDSTNNYIANAILDGSVDHGTVILADEQFAGRGQRGNIWQSEAGSNLTFSIYLNNVNLSVNDQFELNRWISICLIRALRRLGVEALIKWPNDIFVNEQKIAGILIENTIRGQIIAHSIIGVGLNVNQIQFEELNATSLSILKDKRFDIKEILFVILGELNQQAIGNGLEKEYTNNLFLLNVQSKFEDGNGVFEGQILGVSGEGKLLMLVNESIRSFNFKEVKFL